ncbi:hypothetical protein [Candidatus Poriferisodalis sp.]|uniref:hypothetical protein n=1 Tax=Candidatus Poriferisodalis sp. TaxID=3101277 RepID=UPI003B01F1EC
MSEQQRIRLYAWLREQTDEPLAEYLMACLAPAPLSDLVTKDHLSAELSRHTAEFIAHTATFATKDEMNAGFAALRGEHAAQRAEDRRAAQHRHYWLAGTMISVGLSLGVPIWLNTFGVIG